MLGLIKISGNWLAMWLYNVGIIIWRRIFVPFSDRIFRSYIFLGVIGFGAIGIWTEVVKHFLLLEGLYFTCEGGNCDAIISAVSVFYPAVMGVSSLQILLGLDNERSNIPTGLWLFVIAFVPALLFGVFRSHDIFMEFWFYGPIALSVLAVLTCCAANSTNPHLREDEYAAMGGEDVERKLKGEKPRGMKK